MPYLKELCKGIWALTIFFQYLKYELIYDNLNSSHKTGYPLRPLCNKSTFKIIPLK